MYRVNVMGPEGTEDAMYPRVPVAGDILATGWGDMDVTHVRMFNQRTTNNGLAATVYVVKRVLID